MSRFINIPVQKGVARIPKDTFVLNTTNGSIIGGSESNPGLNNPGSSTSSATNISYDNEGTPLEATNVQEAINELSKQKIDHPITAQIGQILEIESVDENGMPNRYKAVDKPQDGKTPVKGTDYFTEAEKQAFVTDVINTLPTWTGGSY